MKEERRREGPPHKPEQDRLRHQLQQALVLHRAGQLAQARTIYQDILSRKKDHFDALHFLGLIAYQTKDLDRAEELIARAIELNGNNPAFHSNRGLVLHDLKRFDEALASYQRAIEIRPAYAEACFNRGTTLTTLGRLDEALADYDRAVEIKPDYAEAYYNRGNTLRDLGRLDEALASYDRAIVARPGYVAAHSNRGNTLKDLGRLDEALASHDKAIAIEPDSAESHCNRGNTLRNLGRLDEALVSYDRAIAIKPDYAEAYCNRGTSLEDLGRFDEALASHDRAIGIKPDFAEAHSNRGNALKDLRRFDEALASYDRALAIKADFAEAHYNRGNALKDIGRLDEALADFERAIAIRPAYVVAHLYRSHTLKDLGRPDEALASHDRALALKRDPALPLDVDAWRGMTSMLVYHPDLSPEARFARQREFGSRMAKRVAEPPMAAANNRDPERRLRIGWLSSDFRLHPVGRNLQPFFDHRDRSRFEAICYSEVRAPDGMTAWLRDRSDEWRSTLGLTDAAVAERIRSDRIDVMIYLAGRFDRNRVQVAAWRPAPVQVSMFDVATSGLEAMDYLIADRLMVPAQGPEKFTERVLRLPSTYVHPGIDDAPDVVALPSLSKGYTTFGCFNNPAKVNDRVLVLWAELLARVPRSRLILKYRNHFKSAQIRDRIEAILDRYDIEKSRVELDGEPEAPASHLARYGEIDIALDPFPFNGSTTTFESLWMGVPVVALEGNSLVSRWSSALLRHVGLDELVARTSEDYVAIAAALAGDIGRLAGLRSQLRRRVSGSVLCDGRQTTRYLERALRATWRAWCEHPPKASEGGRGSPPQTPAPDLTQQKLQQAVALHQAGQLAEAKAIYQDILSRNKDHSEALHLLGLIAYQANEFERAEELIAKAVELNATNPAFHSNRGLALRELGRLEEALASYDRAIEISPVYVKAHFNRGNTLSDLGRFDEALASHDRAIEIKPDYAEAYGNRGNTLKDLGRLDDALASYDRAIEIDPDFAEAHANRGSTLVSLGRRDDGLASYDRALAIRPDFAAVHFARGNALVDLRRFEEALASYDRAIEIKPDFADAWCNRGNTLRELGRFDEALASYDRAIEIRPAYAVAHLNRGNALKNLGRLDEALAGYDRAIAIKPDFVEAFCNRGRSLEDLGRLDAALASHDRAIEIRPDYAQAHFNRGNTLASLGRLDDALASYTRALEVRPDYADAYFNRANTLNDLGRFEEALKSHERAIGIEPDFADAYCNRGVTLTNLGRFDEALASHSQAVAIKPALAWRGLAGLLVYHPDLSPDDRFARHREFGSKIEKGIAEQPAPANDRDPERRLRIGWLSSDFRAHPVGRNLQPFFEHRNRSQFETICYADVRAPDGMTAWLRAHSDEWHSMLGLSDGAVAERIRSDRIDVMIYLAGRFDQNRLQVAAWRPAPVQISMFDVATSGLEAMDYLIADRLMVSRLGVERFTERVLRLPNTYVRPAISSAPDVVAPPSLSNGYATFGCFNNPAKVNDRVLELWGELLARVPRSRLVLKYRNHYRSAQVRDRIAGILGRHGIESSRLELGGEFEPGTSHLARYGGIDVALDPFPFNGSTTTFEALWMGVPVVALEGNSLVSRWSGALLRHVGLDELVARTPADYVGLAGALAGDGSRLARLRSQLRRRVSGSVLCNGSRTNRYLERVVRAVWCAWCKGG